MLLRVASGLAAFVLFALSATATTHGQSSPVPFLNEPLIPTSAAPGGPDLTLTVNGTGFTSASVVNWNGVALQSIYVSGSQLKATVPSANTAQAGTASVTVSTSNGVASNSEFFSISTLTTPAFTSYQVSLPPLPATSGLLWPVAIDINGDGKLDLVGGFLNEMTAALGNGDGSFQTPSFFPLFGGSDFSTFNSATVTGDFNGDRKPDFAFSSINTNALAVVLGNGDGTFGAPQILTLQTNYVANFLYTADVNGDGRLDLISGNNPASGSGNSGTPSFSVCLGNGDGTFQSPIDYPIGTSSYLANMSIGDVNDDGKLDLIAGANGGSGGPGQILFGNGDGTFRSPISAQDLGLAEQWLLADLNGDGNLDVVAQGGGQAGSIGVYFGSATGSFTSAGSYDPGVDCLSPLAVADINADGKLDLIAPSGLSKEVGILLGNGNGTFGQATTYPTTETSSFGIVAADFNGDGMLDLFFGSDTGATVGIGSVLLQGNFPELANAPTSLTFSQQPLSTTSAGQSVALTNSGKAPLAVSEIGIAGTNANDYAETNTCGAALAVNASCQVSITFTPTAQGARKAALSIADNAPGSPQLIALSGQTTPAPLLSLSAPSITFPSQYVGTSGLPQSVTLTNSGDAALTISNVTVSPADFGFLNNCGTALAAAASCSIGVFFDPAKSGSRAGTLTISDNAGGSPQSIVLSGMGQDFSVSAASSSDTVSPGQTATYAISVSPIAGFNQTITLSCTGAPAGSTCSLAQSSVALTASTPTAVNVSVTTIGRSFHRPAGSIAERGNGGPPYLYICGLPGVVILILSGWRRPGGSGRAIAVVIFTALTLAVSGCGGGSDGGGGGSHGTPASTYNLVITGTFASGSANLTHSANLTLVVQ